MVTRQFFRTKFFAAVLATEFVSEVDVLSRELDVAAAKADVPEEADHGRNLERGTYGVHTPVTFLKNFNLLQKDQLHGPLPVDYVQRFERCIEQQDLFEGVTPLGEIPVTGNLAHLRVSFNHFARVGPTRRVSHPPPTAPINRQEFYCAAHHIR